jgi:hypothetical protein
MQPGAQYSETVVMTSEWEPYLTAAESYMRRRRWYGWQKRDMTPEECTAHF